jgi:uncharacterized protein (TIGR02145 family)
MVISQDCHKENSIPVVTTLYVSEITQSSAMSGGHVKENGGTDVIARGVCWDTTSMPDIGSNKTTDGKGNGDFHSSITGLTPYKNYHVRAYATNKAGTGYGDTNDFITATETGFLTDERDGHVYNWVKLGNQIWMAENLAFLPRVNQPIDVSQKPLFYVYDYDGTSTVEAKATSNYATYGALYNWYAVNVGKICPAGWHVPTPSEWTTLTDYLGGESRAGGKLKEAGINHWLSPNQGASNETGFTALPGGTMYADVPYGGYFWYIGEYAYWWTAGEIIPVTAMAKYMEYNNSLISTYSYSLNCGFSVRCIRD